ncbi:MAG: tetratricopeptide repeat protein [Planctomycetota bacterium]|nr:tetratricopeptide repeat protein [Planctomycetota bacterium]
MSRRVEVSIPLASRWSTSGFLFGLCCLLVACGPTGRNPGEPLVETPQPSSVPAASPGDTDPRVEKARKIIGSKPAEARAILAAVLADHPGSFQARFLVAFSWHRQKHYEKARRGFEEILNSGAVFSGSENVLHFHGWALYHLGRLREAAVAFSRHAEKAPTVAATWFGLGLIALEDGRLDEAETFLLKARDLQGRNSKRKIEFARTVARLGEVYELQGRLELARSQFEEATRTWPRHYNAHYKLSRVLLRMGEREAAQAALKQHQEISRGAGG